MIDNNNTYSQNKLIPMTQEIKYNTPEIQERNNNTESHIDLGWLLLFVLLSFIFTGIRSAFDQYEETKSISKLKTFLEASIGACCSFVFLEICLFYNANIHLCAAITGAVGVYGAKKSLTLLESTVFTSLLDRLKQSLNIFINYNKNKDIEK